MAASYERWLIARGNAFSPAAPSVVKLVERLRKEGWLTQPTPSGLSKLRFEGKRERLAKTTGAYAVKTVENRFGNDLDAKIAAATEPLPAALTADWLEDATREELRLVWPVSSEEPSPLQYPLSIAPAGPIRYTLEVHRSDEYVYPTADAIGPLPTTCRCGEDQAFEWDDEELVPTFGASSGIFAECEECSRTFEPSKGSAVITNPFDGSKAEVPGGAAYRFALKVDCGTCFSADPQLAFNPLLVALVENEFGRQFYEVGCTY
ncbi:MAG: hypothetical protein NVS3B10_24560 [Polyangiales bacterium]